MNDYEKNNNKILLNTGYIHGNTFIHNLNTKFKLIIVLLLVCTASITYDLKILSGLFALVSVFFLLSKIPVWSIILRLKFFVWFFIFTNILHLFFTPGESVSYFQIKGLDITYDGILNAAVTSLRLVLIILYTYLFTCTTSPERIVSAFDNMLKPLKLRSNKVDEISKMIMLTFHFIPILIARAQAHVQEYKVDGNHKDTLRGRIDKVSFLVDSYFEVVINDTADLISGITLESSDISKIAT